MNLKHKVTINVARPGGERSSVIQSSRKTIRARIASNHGDPKNWFPKHGKGMDTFRADVKKLLSEGEKPAEQEKKKYYRVQIGAYSVKANAEAQLAKAKKAGFTDAFIKYD